MFSKVNVSRYQLGFFKNVTSIPSGKLVRWEENKPTDLDAKEAGGRQNND